MSNIATSYHVIENDKSYCRNDSKEDIFLHEYRVKYRSRIEKHYEPNRDKHEWSILYKQNKKTPPLKTVEEIFIELMENWKNQTKALSQAASKINNTYYLTIIGLGVTYPGKITKLILEDLQKESSYWHYALKKITQINPVPNEFAANQEKSRSIWLQWGYENKKI